jgi:hypothetical protein
MIAYDCFHISSFHDLPVKGRPSGQRAGLGLAVDSDIMGSIPH